MALRFPQSAIFLYLGAKLEISITALPERNPLQKNSC